MGKNADNIELRSEKVRNIIGQIPPKIIQIGITIIFLIIVGILIGTYFFEYEYTIETTATIEQINDTTHIQIEIPANEINKIRAGHRVLLTFDNIQNLYNQRIETKIQEIPSRLQIADKKGYYVAKIAIISALKTTENEYVDIRKKTEVKAKIITDKEKFFDKIINPLKNILKARE